MDTTPVVRRLRAYSLDPSVATQLETSGFNEVVVKVPWECQLQAGPVGEYVEVVDYDPASQCFYPPVNLNDPDLLAQDGFAPSEGNPQFHQQMVYAVCMSTIRAFERALGRVVLWAPRISKGKGTRIAEDYIQRLRIYPHALREANAYYSPEKKSLLFGYFPASYTSPGRNLPGGIVFTCLSHDIIVHETTHALLDGVHRRYSEASNPDSLAFHEAFADVVALFQHFSHAEVLKDQISKTRGDLGKQNMLGELAQQFGEAIGQYGALRRAIGKLDPVTKQWTPSEPDPTEYVNTAEAHARGAILVAAVFDAFLSIYKARIRDLLRIATKGTGILPEGELHPDLVNRLAAEAAKASSHIRNMCIRALDYCPPVDLTFGDYLRALITADLDLVPDDDLGYRVAVVEAFRRRGIYPRDVRSLSVESLRWYEPAFSSLDEVRDVLKKLVLCWDVTSNRREAYDTMKHNARTIHDWLISGSLSAADFDQMGLDIGDQTDAVNRSLKSPPIEVHSVRPLRRIGPDGQVLNDVIVEITQRRKEKVDPQASDDDAATFHFRGGCTLLFNDETATARYCIFKRMKSNDRLARQRAFLASPSYISLAATYFRQDEISEPFALLHREIQ